jgi:8-oxo-dGTP diphosphatase
VEGIVEAAGGLVWRPGAGGEPEVLLVHRPRYDDWTLPKGKLEPGETHEEAALREVLEEAGLRCERGRELASTSYHDRRGRPKSVRYWSMRPLEGAFHPHDEVDEVRWASFPEAEKLLTHGHDCEVLRAFTAPADA